MKSSVKEMLLTVYLVFAIIVLIGFLFTTEAPMSFSVTSTSTGEKNYETLTIKTKKSVQEYTIATDTHSEGGIETEKSLTAEEAIDYMLQHQQQFGKETADRISETIAKESTRIQKKHRFRLIAPVILAVISTVAFIKTYSDSDSDSDDDL